MHALTGVAARTAPPGASYRSGAPGPLAGREPDASERQDRVKRWTVSPVLPDRALRWGLPRARCGHVRGGQGCGGCRGPGGDPVLHSQQACRRPNRYF